MTNKTNFETNMKVITTSKHEPKVTIGRKYITTHESIRPCGFSLGSNNGISITLSNNIESEVAPGYEGIHISIRKDNSQFGTVRFISKDNDVTYENIIVHVINILTEFEGGKYLEVFNFGIEANKFHKCIIQTSKQLIN